MKRAVATLSVTVFALTSCMIETAAGGGDVTEPVPPGSVGTDLDLDRVVGLNPHPDGGVVFSLDRTVVHLLPDGSIDVLFEEPNTNLVLSAPAVDSDGRLYVGSGNLFGPFSVHVVEPDGTTETYDLGNTFVAGFEVDPITGDVYMPTNLLSPGPKEIRRFVDGVFETLPGSPHTDMVGSAPFAPQTLPYAVRDGSIFTVDGAQVVEFAPDGTSTVVAGTGTVGYSGDGGQAVDAELGRISGVDVHDGVLLISDNQSHTVRLVDGLGVIRTRAGSGQAGFSGDGGESKLAELDLPAAVVSLGLGRFYVSDVGNERIRLVDGLVPAP